MLVIIWALYKPLKTSSVLDCLFTMGRSMIDHRGLMHQIQCKICIVVERKEKHIKPTSYYNMLGSGNARFLSMVLVLIILFQEEFNV
jgi:hypothetical protein